MARANPSGDALDTYRRKRDFAHTPEPEGAAPKSGAGLAFVVQKHHARQLHYDFRLELDGTLKSWAVPKGPSLDPSVKRMAVPVEDHPIDYGGFEGTIPEGHYGAGQVIVWDRGRWTPEGDARQGLAEGKLRFTLHGDKLRGGWTLVRMKGRGRERQPPWLLIKERDAQARAAGDYDVLEAEPHSVLHRVALPAALQPQLATLAAAPPPDADHWIFERKFDGYRLLARLEAGRATLHTRNGHDWSHKLPELCAALARLPAQSAWLDGEIVVAGGHGAPDFQALQNAFELKRTADIVYWLFDLPYLDGEDLRALPVEVRRARLRQLLGRRPPARLRFSKALAGSPPAALLAQAARDGYEGIVGKRKGSAYVPRRSPDWIKLKHQRRQEFVIGGYTAPQGARTGFGALLLGVYDDAGVLHYCGNVGTGFDAARLADLTRRLEKLRSDSPPFEAVPRSVKAQWVRPRLVAEVAFGEWTRDGRVRHASFQGLRADKPAHQIRREAPQPAARTATRRGTPMSLHLTHADRVIDAASGVTKGELADYYARAASCLLPHLAQRPVALVRAPDGVGGELFFQKHAQQATLPGVRLLDPALDPGHEPLLQIDAAQGLMSAAQMNVVELHTWNATSDAIATPDRITFDLDPGEGVDWERMQDAALLLRTVLTELGLPAFLKTSGGKGLHVVVPIRREHGWSAVKGFSQAVVAHLAQVIPERFVAKSGPRNRVGRIFVDYLRNGFGATTVSAWSVRARPGLGISVPVDWDELPELRGAAQWTVRQLGNRLDIGNRPWAGMARQRTGLGKAMKVLGYVPEEG